MSKFAAVCFFIFMSMCQVARADMGTFTGRQVQISGLNGAYGWNCEYSIYGRTVWVVTTGVCPSMLDVR
jgi:uncharacterized membrane protein YphA (DoxX/SURF4 family)